MTTHIVIDFGRPASVRPWRATKRLLRRDREHAWEAWDAFEAEDALAFDRILRVIRSVRALPGGQPGLRVARDTALTYPAARSQLFRGREGIFLRGADADQARRWAESQAALLGGRVRPGPQQPAGERHGAGLPHFHIDLPDGTASGHIFYGTPPSGVFFEAPY